MSQDRLPDALNRISQASRRIEAAALALRDGRQATGLDADQRQAIAAALDELDAVIEGLQG